jgi:hypothetical protein
MLMIPYGLDNRLADGGEVVSLTHRPPLYFPQTSFLLLVVFSVTGLVQARVIVRLEELGKFKKFNDLIGNQTRDLPACSKVP